LHNDDDDDDEEEQEKEETDFEIASTIREVLVPRAILCYTNEIFGSIKMGAEESDDEDLDSHISLPSSVPSVQISSEQPSDCKQQ